MSAAGECDVSEVYFEQRCEAGVASELCELDGRTNERLLFGRPPEGRGSRRVVRSLEGVVPGTRVTRWRMGL
ncbi:hypothetical protein HPP92_021251 [Vanilla planifolia]|uniref:Uncharacterized protein n=1 Tax=Vanilla planifolia TaxID=51239 RepID=A0A835UJ91_VANPL|nr:hypothetical protein HPP92_021613 [Vanilla planifolia]KAG0462775.1 hypothetical protein HPP92_021251 [Vanilla planifolia]